MFAAHYRTQIDNQCGATITSATIKRRGKRFDANGSLEYEDPAATIHTGASIANGTQDDGITQDNTGAANRWLEAELEITIVTGGSPSGDVIIRLQKSVDGGTTWNDDQLGQLVRTFDVQAAGTDRDVQTVS